MPAFGAKDVQGLRKATGAGMMDAKRALTDADGDVEAATQILREKGLIKAAGRTERENVEGVVAIAKGEAGAALVHLKSETDFAAKSDGFRKLAQQMAEAVLVDGPDAATSSHAGLEDLRLTVRENITLGTVCRYEAVANQIIDAYLHGDGRAAVLIQASGVDADTLHEIALHVAFAKPSYLGRDDIPAEDVERERAVLLDITKAEGKPEQAWPKIVEGRLNAWFADRVLFEQGVFGEKETVEARLGGGVIHRFTSAFVG